ncbi:protein TOPLESS-like [Asparagus officinalis]|nr:protein TOPLESS-like [Asparagus officinalis]
MDESTQSLMLFFHLRWHKYFESIIREDRVKALDILNKELRVFQPTYPQLYKEMTQYLTTPREDSALSIESHVKSLRAMAVSEINNVIISHPLLCDKLQFPKFSNKRLLTLLSQSLQGVKMLGMTEK